MGFSNEEYVEELLIEAHRIGKIKEVLDKASFLMSKGKERCLSFILAFQEVNMRFRETSIKDKERLERMVKTEAKKIFSSEIARGQRDLETVEFCVRQSKIAELYLIENFDYKEANKKWHDLIDSEGNYTEVKVYNNISSKNIPFVEKDLKKIRTEGWNFSKWYMLFNITEGEYQLVDKIQVR